MHGGAGTGKLTALATIGADNPAAVDMPEVLQRLHAHGTADTTQLWARDDIAGDDNGRFADCRELGLDEVVRFLNLCAAALERSSAELLRLASSSRLPHHPFGQTAAGAVGGNNLQQPELCTELYVLRDPIPIGQARRSALGGALIAAYERLGGAAQAATAARSAFVAAVQRQQQPAQSVGLAGSVQYTLPGVPKQEVEPSSSSPQAARIKVPAIVIVVTVHDAHSSKVDLYSRMPRELVDAAQQFHVPPITEAALTKRMREILKRALGPRLPKGLTPAHVAEVTADIAAAGSGDIRHALLQLEWTLLPFLAPPADSGDGGSGDRAACAGGVRRERTEISIDSDTDSASDDGWPNRGAPGGINGPASLAAVDGDDGDDPELAAERSRWWRRTRDQYVEAPRAAAGILYGKHAVAEVLAHTTAAPDRLYSYVYENMLEFFAPTEIGAVARCLDVAARQCDPAMVWHSGAASRQHIFAPADDAGTNAGERGPAGRGGSRAFHAQQAQAFAVFGAAVKTYNKQRVLPRGIFALRPGRAPYAPAPAAWIEALPIVEAPPALSADDIDADFAVWGEADSRRFVPRRPELSRIDGACALSAALSGCGVPFRDRLASTECVTDVLPLVALCAMSSPPSLGPQRSSGPTGPAFASQSLSRSTPPPTLAAPVQSWRPPVRAAPPKRTAFLGTGAVTPTSTQPVATSDMTGLSDSTPGACGAGIVPPTQAAEAPAVARTPLVAPPPPEVLPQGVARILETAFPSRFGLAAAAANASGGRPPSRFTPFASAQRWRDQRGGRGVAGGDGAATSNARQAMPCGWVCAPDEAARAAYDRWMQLATVVCLADDPSDGTAASDGTTAGNVAAMSRGQQPSTTSSSSMIDAARQQQQQRAQQSLGDNLFGGALVPQRRTFAVNVERVDD
jgi:hypothetical protein